MKRLLILLLLPVLCVACTPHRPSYEETRFLMDTVCTIRAGGDAKSAVDAAFSMVEEIQKAVNLYTENSTVAAFNRAKAGEEIPLDVHTANILSVALPVCEASGGAFDITIAPVSTLWPFHGEEEPVPPAHETIKSALRQVGYDKLRFQPETRTLTKLTDGVAIDLGGAAKGYAADCAAQILRQAGVPYAVLDFGGNIYVYGANPNRKDNHWQIGIQEPFLDAGSYRTTVTLKEGAVVTSGTYQRNFTHNGILYHHILNPKTGFPAESGLCSVSVKAASALLADCLSTACLVLGDNGKALAEQFQAELVAVF